MFKTYLKAWVVSWFAVWIAASVSLAIFASSGKWETSGFKLHELSAVVAGACLIASIIPLGETLKWVKKLREAQIRKEWLDFNCKSIDLTVEQLVKAELAEVCWLKGTPDLSEYLFNPHYCREGDCEYLYRFIEATPLRESKPSAFIVNIQIGDTVFTGQSNYFKGSWKLMPSQREGALRWDLSDGLISREVESVGRLTIWKQLKLVKALSIMQHFDNWAHYERSLTLVDVVKELEYTKNNKITRSAEIRDFKDAVKAHLLSGDYTNENFRKFLCDIVKKSEEAKSSTDDKKVESAA